MTAKYFYVQHENHEDDTLTVSRFFSSDNVVSFIEKKINEHGYHLNDFTVIKGKELSLSIVQEPARVLLTG